MVAQLRRMMEAILSGAAAANTWLARRLLLGYWGAYAVAKAGLEMLAHIYAEEVRKTAVRVNPLDPGPVRTAMRARAMPGEDPATLPVPDSIAGEVVRLGRRAAG